MPPGAHRSGPWKDAAPPDPASVAAKAGASPGWWDSVQKDLAAGEYAAHEVEGAGLTAVNRAQGLRVSFAPSRVAIRPAGAASDSEAWVWQWETRAWGRPGAMHPLPPVKPLAEGSRVQYVRSGVLERYTNAAAGLTQAFTLATRPDSIGLLTIEGRVLPGPATTHIEPDSASFVVRDARGADALAAVKLVAHDATGKRLRASLSLPERTLLALRIDDSRATYPLGVEMTLGTPAPPDTTHAAPPTPHRAK